MSFGFSVIDFITVIELANKIRKEFLDAPGHFKAISEEVRSLSIILQDADILTGRPLSRTQAAELSAVAAGCTGVLEDLTLTLDRYRALERQPTDLGGKLKKAWKRVTWEPEDVRDLRSRITSNVTLLEALNGRITRENTFKLVKVQEDKERTAILEWLTSTEYASQQSDFIERRQPGTGEWFLESKEYRDWVSRNVPTLFSPGIPGSGKTIIASIVIEDLMNRYYQDPNIGIAYIYLNFRQQEKQKVQNLLASLLKQLLHKRPALPESIKLLYEELSIQGTRPSTVELSTALRSVAASYASIFIVIDALDECRVADGCRQEFLQELFALQSGAGAQLLATSRWIPEITESFQDSLTLQIRASDQDVQIYVDCTIPQLPRCVRDDSELQAEIKRMIVQSVDGMFLLAQLHLDSLKGKKSRKAVRLALQNLPTGSGAYDFAYDEAMARIEGQLQDEKALAKQVLLWISSAMRPLKTFELEHALAIEIEESSLDEDNLCPVEEMVSVCAGLVTIDQESGIVRLVHFTTQQYFERTRSKWFVDGDLEITTACMTYLHFDEFANGPCEDEDSAAERMRSHPLYDYVATNWGFHAKRCGNEAISLTDIFEYQNHVDSMSQALMASMTWPLHIEFSDYYARGMTGLHVAAFFCYQEMAEYHLSRGIAPDCLDSHKRTPLCWAAMKGDVGIVKLLLDTGKVDPLKEDNNTRTPLSWAAQGGFLDIVELLLKSDPNLDPDSVDSFGWTPLCWAAEYGREDVVKLFLSLGNVNPSSKDKDNRTPLSWAAENGHKNIVQILIDATGGADADLPNSYGWTPMAFAADFGHDDVIQLLMDAAGARPDSIDSDGRTVIFWAAQFGHDSTVRLLMNHPDVDVSVRDNDGRTPISVAAQYGNYNVVKSLLEAALKDGDAADDYGWTPVIWAAEYGHVSVIELLIDAGKALPDAKDKNLRGPISWAAENGRVEVVEMLLGREDVDASAPDLDGRTPLHWAAANGNSKIVSLLLDSGAVNIDLKDGREGLTPLSAAAKSGHTQSVQLLIQSGEADVNTTDVKGKTPLALAAKLGQAEVAGILVDAKGVDINKRDDVGWSPLHYAAYHGWLALTKGLLALPNIEPDARDTEGRTPLSWAASTSYLAVLEALLAHPGVDANSRDRAGRTPLYWAAHAGQSKVVKKLVASDSFSGSVEEECWDNSGASAVQVAYRNGHHEVAELLVRLGALWPLDFYGLQGMFSEDE